MDDYVNRIIFLPFNGIEFGKYAITDRRDLSIIINDSPQKDISSILNYKFLEL